MSANAAPSTALDRARIAYQEMQRREYNVAMKQRARSRVRNIALSATLASMVAILLGVSIYNDWMPAPSRSSAHEPRADKGRLGAARTAQVKSFVRGNTCQELHFNNDNGTFVGGNLVPCEAEPKREPFAGTLLPKGSRLNSIRDPLVR